MYAVSNRARIRIESQCDTSSRQPGLELSLQQMTTVADLAEAKVLRVSTPLPASRTVRPQRIHSEDHDLNRALNSDRAADQDKI